MDIALADKSRAQVYKILEEKVLKEYPGYYKEYTKLVRDSIQKSIKCCMFYTHIYDDRVSGGRLPIEVKKLVEHKLKEKGYEVKYETGLEANIKVSWQ